MDPNGASMTEQELMALPEVNAALSTKENLTPKNASEIINLIFDGFTDTLKKAAGLNSEDSGVLP